MPGAPVSFRGPPYSIALGCASPRGRLRHRVDLLGRCLSQRRSGQTVGEGDEQAASEWTRRRGGARSSSKMPCTISLRPVSARSWMSSTVKGASSRGRVAIPSAGSPGCDRFGEVHRAAFPSASRRLPTVPAAAGLRTGHGSSRRDRHGRCLLEEVRCDLLRDLLPAHPLADLADADVAAWAQFQGAAASLHEVVRTGEARHEPARRHEVRDEDADDGGGLATA